MDHTVLHANNTTPAFPSCAFTRCRHHSNCGSRHLSNCSSLLIYRPRKDERLSWPSWLTYSGWLTHISGHPSAASRAQDSERTPAKDRCYTAGLRNQQLTFFDGFYVFKNNLSRFYVVNVYMPILVNSDTNDEANKQQTVLIVKCENHTIQRPDSIF